ncbi:MAG: hypothetical protein ABWY05_02115, partial [Noviherbaspirillum sp.]
PNRTVKRLCADDSAATSVKVGHRQAVTPENPRRRKAAGVFALGRLLYRLPRYRMRRAGQCRSLPMSIFVKRMTLLRVYALDHFVDGMQVFDGIICKKLFVLLLAGK